MFTKTTIKVFLFGLLTNLPIDTKIKITKLLAISQILHLIKLHGRWDGHLELIQKIQTVKLTQSTPPVHNLTKQWLLVLKTLDLLWLVKLNKSLMVPFKSHLLIAKPQLGIHAECAKMELP